MFELVMWRARSRREIVLAAVWLLVLAAGVILVVRRAWVSDDIFITFRYCDNVLAGHGPVYNPGERSEGYTHFIWFLLLALGRALGIEAEILGKYLGIPAFVGCLALLVHISGRLFPGRGGLWGVPVAALGWAWHEDARLFASGGLETSFFVFVLLLGFEFLCLSSHPRRAVLAGWAYAVACLVRPEGLLYSGLALLYLAWRSSRDRREVRDFVAVWLILVAPLFAFRMLYYGYPLPNPYYAKSGGLSYWTQGLHYLRIYFECYFVLGAAALAAWPLGRGLRRTAAGPLAPAAAPLALAYVSALLTILYVTRVGGDFMFARFFIPITAYLLLLCEYLVQHLGRPAWRLAATAALLGLVLAGVWHKHGRFAGKTDYYSIVDEPQFYPDSRLEEVRQQAAALRQCLAGTHAVLMVQGGQAGLAYYARFPVAIERYGLTDVHIAHSPGRGRGRPGHEKYATPDYLYSRGVNLRIHYMPVRNVAQYTLFGLPGVNGEIIVYDRPLMEHIKTCSGAIFLDFPLWLQQTYIPDIPNRLPQRLVADFNHFKSFYFDHNPDPEGLQDKLRAAFDARGLRDIPSQPLAPDAFQDTGLRTDRPPR